MGGGPAGGLGLLGVLTLVAEPGWDALAAPLADATQAGHNAQALLTEAATSRELDTADSISGVLVWRLVRAAGEDRASTPRGR